MTISELRGRGRWAEAIVSTDDPLLRAELLNEQALLEEARQAAESSGAIAFLNRVDAALAKLP